MYVNFSVFLTIRRVWLGIWTRSKCLHTSQNTAFLSISPGILSSYWEWKWFTLLPSQAIERHCFYEKNCNIVALQFSTSWCKRSKKSM